MNARAFLSAEVVDLERMLAEAKDDPVLAPQLSARLERRKR